jgi:hypothetical protein
MKKKIKKEWKNIIFNIIFAVLVLLIVIIFYKNILLTTLLELILAIIGLLKWKSKVTLIIFIFGGIFGGIAEIIAINYNVWNYSITNWMHIPFWLFFVWGNASSFIYQAAIEIKKLGIKR